jgi:uncharacterized protein (DUF433 family)
MKYLDSNPEIARGELIIKGTRIRIAQVLRMLSNGMTIEQIHADWWPWLPMRTLQGAVAEAIDRLDKRIHA